ncbi:MAG TPA: dihydrolipoyl dehydrogenase [Elusimicrobiales bacterium]|nr:dihydrolipoyl dehydrogenase [Elusimicrobiales bacterium]
MSKKIIVIGSGPAGYPAAFKLAELGAEVTVVEKEQVGGVCLNWGCIASKSYLDAAHRFHAMHSLKDLTQDGSENLLKSVQDKLSWEKIQNRRLHTITKLRNGLKMQFKAKKINLVSGTASFKSSNEINIETDGKTITEKFDYAIIACGTESFFPPPFNAHKEKLLDNKTVFSLEKLPKSIIIVGGGVIGVEFACLFNAMGTKVDIVEIMPDILVGEDANIVRVLKTSFEKSGIKIHLGKKAKDVEINGGVKKITLEDGTEMQAEHILVAAGRTAELENLKLDNVSVKWDKKGIAVDENFQAGQKNIYIIGDVNGKMLLAHAASAQGVACANNIMGQKSFYDNNLVPKCIYTWPESASVGLNKTQAEKAGKQVKTLKAFFMSNGKAQATGETQGFVQITVDAASDEILGAQIIGSGATEIIHTFAVALYTKMKTEDLKKIIFAHPTMSETIHEALYR